jgi:hypothetical protein
MLAHIGDLPRPSLKMRLKRFPARESAASNRVPVPPVAGLGLDPVDEIAAPRTRDIKE